jgi:hypothetical protein
MATRKPAVPQEEKFEKQDFDLFGALLALDKKDYGYFDNLTPEQQRKFTAFMLVRYMSYLKGSGEIAGYYAMSTNYHANKYIFNEYVQKHPKLQWLMLCAASPGLGKQFHPWIPQIREKVSLLKEPAQLKEVKEYYKKIYPKAGEDDITDVAKAYVQEQKKKMYLASVYPTMKIADIEVLSQTVTDEEINQYERDRGNR